MLRNLGKRLLLACGIILPCILAGCVVEEEKNEPPVGRAVCVIRAGGAIVGGGVLLEGKCGEEGRRSVWLLTARHVVTYNHAYAGCLSVVCRIDGGVAERSLAWNTWGRWMTHPAEGVDVVWIKLLEDEIPAGASPLKMDAIAKSRIEWRKGKKVDVHAPVEIKPQEYECATVVRDVTFESNRNLKVVSWLPVFVLKGAVATNDSGSPAFALDADGREALAGIISISRPDVAGCIDVRSFLTKIQQNAIGSSVTRLADCPGLW